MFRMLDEEWTSLAPNRRDHRPYRGSSCENENFYGGTSVVFCVPAGFFEKKAIDVDIQLYVRKEVCEYFEMDSCQSVGFATVPVDDLLNGIAKQMRERNELSEHLSDSYKQQIISRSTTGTYNLLDENFRTTAATISLYIRISSLGKCLVTEITRVESGIRGAFCARREPDEEQYLTRQLTADELQSGRWNVGDFPCVPRGRLVCRCEELIRKKDAAADLAVRRTREFVARLADVDRFVTTTSVGDAAAIAKMRAAIEDVDVGARERIAADITARDAPEIAKMRAAIEDADVGARERIAADIIARDAPEIAKMRAAIEDDDVGARERIVADVAARDAPEIAKMRAAIEDADVDAKERIAANAAVRKRRIKRKALKDAKRRAIERAKSKRVAIKENGKTTFQKAFFVSSKSKCEKDRATICIAEEETKIFPCAPVSACPPLQTHPLCSELQPHLTCFTDHFNVSSHCYGMDSSLQFINRV
ncbi:hypothetical protein ACS0PU_001475 [Formica fusca]